MQKKYNIVLINPKAGEQKIISGVPHSILAINETLRKTGYSTCLFDEKNPSYQFEDLVKHTEILGFSVMTGPQIKYALDLCVIAKRINPLIKIIWGGWHSTLIPEQTLKNPNIDYIYRGEASERLIKLIDALILDKKPENIEGIGFKNNCEILLTDYKPTLDNKKEFIDYTQYDLSFYTKRGVIDLITSYGCPFKCGFCAQTSVFGCAWKGLNADKLFELINYLKIKYSINEFEFVDTNFFIQKKRVLEFSKLLITSKTGIKWNASVRADQIIDYTDDEFKLIVDSGFNVAAIGFESGSEKILSLINKGETIDDYKKCIEKLKKFNVKIFGTFIIGIPGETKKDIEDTFKLAEYIKNEYALARLAFLYFTPYPETKLFDVAVSYGFKQPEELNDWADFSHNNINIPWLSKDMKSVIDKKIMRMHSIKEIGGLKEGDRVYIYGTALSGEIALEICEAQNIIVDSFVETQPKIFFFMNYNVISFDQLKTLNIENIVIASYGYQKEIEKELRNWNDKIRIIKLYPETIFYI